MKKKLQEVDIDVFKKVVGKLIDLSECGKITWSAGYISLNDYLFLCNDSPKFHSYFMGKNLVIWEGSYSRKDNDRDSFKAPALAVVERGNILFSFPYLANIKELYEVARYKASGIEKIISALVTE